MRAALNEPGTDTDDQSDVPRSRSFRAEGASRVDGSEHSEEPRSKTSTPVRRSRLSRNKSLLNQPKISSFFESTGKVQSPDVKKSQSEQAEKVETAVEPVVEPVEDKSAVETISNDVIVNPDSVNPQITSDAKSSENLESNTSEEKKTSVEDASINSKTKIDENVTKDEVKVSSRRSSRRSEIDR